MNSIFTLITFLKCSANLGIDNKQSNKVLCEEPKHESVQKNESSNSTMIDATIIHQKLPKHSCLSNNEVTSAVVNYVAINQEVNLAQLEKNFLSEKESVEAKYLVINEIVNSNSSYNKKQKKEIKDLKKKFEVYEHHFFDNLIENYNDTINKFRDYIVILQENHISSKVIEDMNKEISSYFLTIIDYRKWWNEAKEDLIDYFEDLKENAVFFYLLPDLYLKRYLKTSTKYLDGFIEEQNSLILKMLRLAKEKSLPLKWD